MRSIRTLFVIFTASAEVLCGAPKKDAILGDLEWRNIGPANMGGRVTAIEGVVGDPNTFYVGGADGGIFKTTNNGVTFDEIFNDQDAYSIGSITVAPSDPNVLWVGTGEGDPRNSVGYGRGVYLSIDGGESWKKVGLEKTERIKRIVVDPRNPDVAAVCAMGREWGPNPERGVFITEDGGKSWDKVLYIDEDTGCSDIAMELQNPRIMYAGMWTFRRKPWRFDDGGKETALYRTLDGGRNWAKIHNGLPKTAMARIGVQVAQSSPETVYLVTEFEGGGTLYRSDDRGDNWRMVNDNARINFRPFYYSDIRVDPNNPDHVYSLSGGLYKSTDGGKEFKSIGRGVHGDHQAFWIDPYNSDRLLSGSDGGYQLSYDAGETWDIINNVTLSQFYQIFVDDELPYNVLGGLQDNGTWSINSDDASSDWSAIGSGDGAYSAFAKQGQVFVFSSQNGDVMLNDYSNPFNWSIGYTWFGLTPKGASDMLFINPFILDPSDEDIVYYAGGQTVWRNNSIDMSKSVNYELDSDLNYYVSTQWQQLSNTSVSGQISSFGASKANPSHRLYYGTSEGKVYRLEGANEGTNTPTEVTGSSFPFGGYVSSIAVDPTDGDRALAAFSNYSVVSLWYTADAGTTWTDVSGNLEEKADGTGVGPSVRTALILAYGGAPQYLVGTSTGLYSTTALNGSSTQWASEGSETIGNVVVDALAGRDSDGTVVVGTHGNGVFKLSFVQHHSRIADCICH